MYPCAGHSVEDPQWLALSVVTEAHWQALRGWLGDPSWADLRFEGVEGRQHHQVELDRRLGEWTGGFDAFELMARLQEAGVRAGVVQTVEDLLSDPQLLHRGHFRRLVHPVLGELAYEHSGFRLSASPPRLERPGPRLGEHNDDVLQGILGLDPDEVRRLVAAGVVA